MSAQLPTGLLLAGTYLGVKQTNRTGKDGNAWTQTFAGIRVPKANGFSSDDCETVSVQIPNELLDSGITGRLAMYIGKPMILPVWVRAFPSKNGAGYSYMLQDENFLIEDFELINPSTGEVIETQTAAA